MDFPILWQRFVSKARMGEIDGPEIGTGENLEIVTFGMALGEVGVSCLKKGQRSGRSHPRGGVRDQALQKGPKSSPRQQFCYPEGVLYMIVGGAVRKEKRTGL